MESNSEIRRIRIDGKEYEVRDESTYNLLTETIHAINQKNKDISNILSQLNESIKGVNGLPVDGAEGDVLTMVDGHPSWAKAAESLHLTEVESSDEIEENQDTVYFQPEGHLIAFNGTTYRTFSWIHFDDDPEQGGEWMQVCFYDKRKEGFVFSNNSDDWDTENMTPIGVVVVPMSHDVYGDGRAGVMSLVNMSYKTPDKGDIDRESVDDMLIYWGGSNSGATVYNAFPILGNCSGPVQTKLTGTLQGNVFLPNDKWPSGPVCLTDNTTKYYDSNDASRGWLPSPYNGTKRNPLYYQTTSPATSLNPLSRFDGDVVSASILEKNTTQSEWKTDAEIKNESKDGSFPSAACCWRFHTEHTEQGQWYLPAEGELCYVVPRFSKIERTLTKLNEVYGNVTTPIEFDKTQNYFSCNLNSSTGANRISTMNGTAGSRNITQTGGVRAFIKIKPIED